MKRMFVVSLLFLALQAVVVHADDKLACPGNIPHWSSPHVGLGNPDLSTCLYGKPFVRIDLRRQFSLRGVGPHNRLSDYEWFLSEADFDRTCAELAKSPKMPFFTKVGSGGAMRPAISVRCDDLDGEIVIISHRSAVGYRASKRRRNLVVRRADYAPEPITLGTDPQCEKPWTAAGAFTDGFCFKTDPVMRGWTGRSYRNWQVSEQEACWHEHRIAADNCSSGYGYWSNLLVPTPSGLVLQFKVLNNW